MTTDPRQPAQRRNRRPADPSEQRPGRRIARKRPARRPTTTAPTLGTSVSNAANPPEIAAATSATGDQRPNAANSAGRARSDQPRVTGATSQRPTSDTVGQGAPRPSQGQLWNRDDPDWWDRFLGGPARTPRPAPATLAWRRRRETLIAARECLHGLLACLIPTLGALALMSLAVFGAVTLINRAEAFTSAPRGNMAIHPISPAATSRVAPKMDLASFSTPRPTAAPSPTMPPDTARRTLVVGMLARSKCVSSNGEGYDISTGPIQVQIGGIEAASTCGAAGFEPSSDDRCGPCDHPASDSDSDSDKAHHSKKDHDGDKTDRDRDGRGWYCTCQTSRGGDGYSRDGAPGAYRPGSYYSGPPSGYQGGWGWGPSNANPPAGYNGYPSGYYQPGANPDAYRGASPDGSQGPSWCRNFAPTQALPSGGVVCAPAGAARPSYPNNGW